MKSCLLFVYVCMCVRAPQAAPVVENLPANAGGIREAASIPELGRSPGGGPGNPLQDSCLELLILLVLCHFILRTTHG